MYETYLRSVAGVESSDRTFVVDALRRRANALVGVWWVEGGDGTIRVPNEGVRCIKLGKVVSRDRARCDIDANRVDCVLVYKVDRLSRSLTQRQVLEFPEF